MGEKPELCPNCSCDELFVGHLGGVACAVCFTPRPEYALARSASEAQAEEDVFHEVASDGQHPPGEQRCWLARKLMDSTLTDQEAFNVVAYHPDISDQRTAPNRAAQARGWQHCEVPKRCLNYVGAMADLDSVLDVLIRRINGEADLASAAEWVRLNYPRKAAALSPPVEGREP